MKVRELVLNFTFWAGGGAGAWYLFRHLDQGLFISLLGGVGIGLVGVIGLALLLNLLD